MRYAWILISVALAAVAAPVARCSGERDAVTPLHKYDGSTRESVIAALGEPQHVLSIRRSNAGTEFHGSLLSLPAARGEDPEYMELRWDLGRKWRTLFLEQRGQTWYVVEGFDWGKGVQF